MQPAVTLGLVLGIVALVALTVIVPRAEGTESAFRIDRR
jgi:hypothetical protein